MTAGRTEPNPTAAYYEDFYRGTGPFEGVTFGTVPWDIVAPQPAVVEAERSGLLRGRILDIGCGLGENAIHLARCGHDVTGVDVAPTAVAGARDRAAAAGVATRFVTADATGPGALPPGPFDAVLDCTLFESLEPAARQDLAVAAGDAARAGAGLALICIVADLLPAELPGVLPFSPAELERTLAAGGWEIRSRIRTDVVCNAFATGFFRHIGVDVRTDDEGRALLPAWSVSARRR